MRGMRTVGVLVWAAAAALPGWGQPTISSLQSSVPNDSPANVTGITSGTTVPGGGFFLYVNSAIGDFNPNAFQNVTWNGTPLAPPPSTELTPNQITVFVPNSLFQAAVASPVSVNIVVHEAGRTSNSATFTVNPPLQACRAHPGQRNAQRALQRGLHYRRNPSLPGERYRHPAAGPHRPTPQRYHHRHSHAIRRLQFPGLCRGFLGELRQRPRHD